MLRLPVPISGKGEGATLAIGAARRWSHRRPERRSPSPLHPLLASIKGEGA